MSEPKYMLVVDATAGQVERAIGVRAIDTPFGALAPQPRPFNTQRELVEIERALNPSRCTCGKWSVIHSPNCPMALVTT
jgi:hypothetical protein